MAKNNVETAMKERLAILWSDEHEYLSVVPMTCLGGRNVQEYVRADTLSVMSKAINDIRVERQKQVSKGYDANHDDADKKGAHARAAAYYATAAYYQREWDCDDSDNTDEFHRIEMERQYVQHQADDDSIGYPWPCETKSVEYSPRANLVKAAALLIAEIERIDREESSND